MVNKYFKWCSITLVIRKIKIKTPLRYHYTFRKFPTLIHPRENDTLVKPFYQAIWQYLETLKVCLSIPVILFYVCPRCIYTIVYCSIVRDNRKKQSWNSVVFMKWSTILQLRRIKCIFHLYHVYGFTFHIYGCIGASLVAQMIKNPPVRQEAWVWTLRQEDPLEKGMATQSSILARRTPVDRGARGL